MAAVSGEGQRVALLLKLSHSRPRILRYCRARLGVEQDAEDVCQEVYLELWAQSDRLVDHAEPIGWLFVTARNKCHESLRRRKPVADPSEVADRRAQDVLDMLVEVEDVQGLLDRLPAALREVAELRCQGYSSREIGQRLRPPISENAVNMKLHRIRALLRLWLRGRDDS